MSSHHCLYTYISDDCFLPHFCLVFFHSSSWGWLVKLVWVWRKPWRRKPSRTTRRLMTDFEPSSAGRCQDSRDRVPWAVETEVCKRMFSLKVSSSCDVATEATFHSFGLIAFANLWCFFKMVAPCFRFFAHASWVKFPDLAKCEKDMAAAPVAAMTSSKKKQLQDLKLRPENQRGLVRFLHFPYSSRSLWYILLITYSWNLLTCNLDHLPHFTQMEAPGKFSERSDIPQHYVTTFPTSVDEVERFTGAFP